MKQTQQNLFVTIALFYLKALFLIEQSLTRYSEITLSLLIEQVKVQFNPQERIFFVIWRIQIRKHKIIMKIVNIFVPRGRKTIYAIQEFEKVYLYRKKRVLKNSIHLRCRKAACKRNLKLHLLNKLRYEHYHFFKLVVSLKNHINS